jgi:hypothetical protein
MTERGEPKPMPEAIRKRMVRELWCDGAAESVD